MYSFHVLAALIVNSQPYGVKMVELGPFPIGCAVEIVQGMKVAG